MDLSVPFLDIATVAPSTHTNPRVRNYLQHDRQKRLAALAKWQTVSVQRETRYRFERGEDANMWLFLEICRMGRVKHNPSKRKP